MEERKIKISTQYRKRTYDSVTDPKITLKGKWLKKLGFEPGDIVNIEQKGKNLIISPV